MKLFLRGRPIVLHAPTDIRDSFDISKVQPAPAKKLKLDWVYGYRGKDCRSNLYQLPTGEMVYFVAAAVVLYNVDEQSQRHYLGHTDDVKRCVGRTTIIYYPFTKMISKMKHILFFPSKITA